MLLVDTGILYALADTRDAWHARARHLVERESDTLVAPVTILPEVAYLLHTRLGPHAELAFARSIALGEVDVEKLTHADLARTADVMAAYPAIGFVDASLVAIAERLKQRRLATTDRRHFAAVRPHHAERFDLIP